MTHYLVIFWHFHLYLGARLELANNDSKIPHDLSLDPKCKSMLMPKGKIG